MNLQDIASASAMIKQELEPLAQKIGEGAEYTFSLFVRQVYVEGIMNLFWIVPGIIVLVFSRKMWTASKNQSYSSDKDGMRFVSMGLLLVGLTALLLPLANLVQVVINPEFAAIKLIIDTVKGQ